MELQVETSKRKIEKFVAKVERPISEFFGVEFTTPAIHLVRSSKVFVKLCAKGQGTRKKNFNGDEIVDAYETTTAFYSHDNNQVIFPKFRRSGEYKFEIPKKMFVHTQTVIHELIHAVQFQNGDYSESDFFDETCAEFCSYVLAGSIEPYNHHDYFHETAHLFTLLESVLKDHQGMLEWVKDYNVAKDKDAKLQNILKRYIRKHKVNNINWRTLLNLFEGCYRDVKKKERIKELPRFSNIDLIHVQDSLYRLFEKHRIL